MPVHSPLRCSRSIMVQRGANEVVLLDPGSYQTVSNYLNNTATFNGTDWNADPVLTLDPNGPLPGRVDMAGAYDGYNVMIYGGKSSTAPLQDTWRFNGTNWLKLNPTTVPFARYKAKACRLTTTSTHVVMFGGYGGANNLLSEQFDWDGYAQTWTQKVNTVNPAARIDHVMAGGATFTIMFGGSNGTNQLNDTWKLDTSNVWTQMTPTGSPSARSRMCMAFDVTNSKWVMFGGCDTYNFLPETWTLNSTGTAWTKAAPATSPPGLLDSQMCWDAQSGKILMFGGISATTTKPSNRTWTWDNTTWTLI